MTLCTERVTPILIKSQFKTRHSMYTANQNCEINFCYCFRCTLNSTEATHCFFIVSTQILCESQNAFGTADFKVIMIEVRRKFNLNVWFNAYQTLMCIFVALYSEADAPFPRVCAAYFQTRVSCGFLQLSFCFFKELDLIQFFGCKNSFDKSFVLGSQ